VRLAAAFRSASCPCIYTTGVSAYDCCLPFCVQPPSFFAVGALQRAILFLRHRQGTRLPSGLHACGRVSLEYGRL
jgi:hypothetical protein